MNTNLPGCAAYLTQVCESSETDSLEKGSSAASDVLNAVQDVRLVYFFFVAIPIQAFSPSTIST